MNDAFDNIIHDFEYETDPTYKEALLKRILNALQNGRLKEKVQDFLIGYFPNQNKYRDYRVIALRNSNQLNELQLEFLKKAFINGTIEIRYDASYAFKKHIKNQEVFKFLKEIILNCSNPDILAHAISSIITNDLSELERDELINTIEVDVPMVQFYLFKHKVFTKKHAQNDITLMLPVVNQMPYQLKQDVINFLIDGFNKNKVLKKILIKSLERRNFHNEHKNLIDYEIAWKVLFDCFNKDADVINIIKLQFDNEEFPFNSANTNEIFQNLIHYFKGNNELMSSVENWLEKRMKKYSHIDPEVAFASIFVHSENIKKILFEDLPKTGVSHWNVMALLDGWPNDYEIKEKLKKYYRNIEPSKTSASAHFISKVFDSSEKEEAIKILERILFDKKITFRERSISALIELDKQYFETNILKTLISELDTFPKDFWGQYYSALDVIVKNFHSNKIVQTYVSERIENESSFYSLSVLYFPELIKAEEKLLKKSIPLSKEFRLLIIESFTDSSILPSNIETVLNNFEIEAAEEEVMGDMAICLFNYLKENNPSKIIELSKSLVFARGLDYEVKRSIAFTGFLISRKLDEYFSIEDTENKSKDKSRMLDIFNDYSYRKSSSGIMIKSIIDNFEYLISYTGKDFKSFVEILKFNKDVEDIWGFFARYSAKSSPTYKHIMDFVSNHSATIKNKSIISFLNRTSPRCAILKDILLRFIKNDEGSNKILAGRLLGTNFKNDSQVYEEMIKVEHFTDTGRIIALCNGWSHEPILRKIFDDIVDNQYHVDNYVSFNLKFLFRDIENLTIFLKNVITNTDDLKSYHQYFYFPMIERLKRDKVFSLAIKNLLLSTDSINEKISFYNLLSQVNMLDDDITSWKNKISDFNNDFGYDIVSNKIVRLKDILHDYYY